MRIGNFICMTALLAMVAVAPRVWAETTPVEGAIEAWKVYVERAEGAPAALRVLPCRGCEPKRFTVDEDFTLIVEGERVSSNQIGRHGGESGTVIYNLESGRAVRLLR